MLVGVICGNVGRNLFGDEFGRYNAINIRFIAVDALPFEGEVEGDFSAVGQFHLIFILVHLNLEDANLRKISLDKSVDFRIVTRRSATIPAAVSDNIEVGVELDFLSILEFNLPTIMLSLDLLDLLKEDASWATTHNITMLILGCVVAFIVALFAMKWFVGFLTKYGFKAFGIYRIVVGGIIIILLLTGHSLAMVD